MDAMLGNPERGLSKDNLRIEQMIMGLGIWNYSTKAQVSLKFANAYFGGSCDVDCAVPMEK